jgi:hypothetical protein
VVANVIKKATSRSAQIRAKNAPIRGITNDGITRLIERKITVRTVREAVRKPAVVYRTVDSKGRPAVEYWAKSNDLVVLNSRGQIVTARRMNRREIRNMFGPNG